MSIESTCYPFVEQLNARVVPADIYEGIMIDGAFQLPTTLWDHDILVSFVLVHVASS